MATILYQKYHDDRQLGRIGIHKVQFTSTSPDTERVTVPTLAAKGVEIIDGTVRGARMGDAVAATLTGLFDATIGVNGETITIGGVVYTTRASALTASTVVGEFVAPAVAATKLANFINVVNGVGDGTNVGTGARPNPSVYAYATGTAGTVGVVSRIPGTIGNGIIVAENCAGAIFAWTGAATALASGTGVTVDAVQYSTTTTSVIFTGFTTGDVVSFLTYHGNTANYASVG